MKVAYVLSDLHKPGGWRNHACAFLEAIRAYVEPVLYVSAADGAIAHSLFPECAIFTLPVTQQAALSSWSGFPRLAAACWEIRRGDFPAVDLVHSLEAYPTGLVGSWLARRLGCPHAITTHGTYGVIWIERALDRRAYEQVLQRTKLVCPVSQGTAQLVQRYFGESLTHATVHTILNGNHFYKSFPRAAAFDRPFPPTPTVLSVGDVKPRKGQLTSLAAFASVKSRLPAARYLIAGSYQQDDYYRKLQQFIVEHGLQDVTFLGRVSESDLHHLYQESSLFVLAPQQAGLHFEGFGLVYLEAGAYGLPVVGTRTGGVPDAVKDGETGVLVEPGDVPGLAEAVFQLLADPELARRMGQANRVWAETLTWERTALEQFRAYQSLDCA